MKKKIICYIGLVLVVLMAFVISNGNINFMTTNISNEYFEFNWSSFLTAVGIETFVTIHMSVFVLMPLSKIINSQKNLKIFLILFMARIVILLIGDIFAPYIMMGIDFIAVFIGAFILVPVLGSAKNVIFKNGIRYGEYPEIEFDELSRIGLTDSELLERALLQRYVEIKQAACNFDYKSLARLCSAHQYMLYKNEMNLLEQVDEKNRFLDFNVKDVKIFYANKSNDEIQIDIVAKFECLEFTLNNYNKVVRGSDRDKKDVMVELKFIQKLNSNMVKVCPNCAAPVKDGNVEFCGYCGTALNYKVGEWLLVNENRVYEK